MTEGSQGHTGSALSLTVTVSTLPAFVPTVEALAAKVGEYVGCPADDARHLGQALGRALDGIAHRAGATHVPGRFDIVFMGNGRVLRVDLACPSPLPSGLTLEDVLGGADAVERLRGSVDRLEFGHAAGRPYCRLTRQIRAPR